MEYEIVTLEEKNCCRRVSARTNNASPDMGSCDWRAVELLL